MDYVILIYGDENAAGPTPGTPEFQDYLSGWMGFNEYLKASGSHISGAELQPSGTATTLRRTFGAGQPTVTDGPFAETKEQLGGFYLVSAENLDAALEIAKRLPLPAGSIEVRPTTSGVDQM